jgi:hypothetical protein
MPPWKRPTVLPRHLHLHRLTKKRFRLLSGKESTRHGEEGVPLLEQEGWTRHQENAAKPPLRGRGGQLWRILQKCLRNISSTTDHPGRAASEAVFFLMAQPPLLFQEGNTLASRHSHLQSHGRRRHSASLDHRRPEDRHLSDERLYGHSPTQRAHRYNRSPRCPGYAQPRRIVHFKN